MPSNHNTSVPKFSSFNSVKAKKNPITKSNKKYRSSHDQVSSNHAKSSFPSHRSIQSNFAVDTKGEKQNLLYGINKRPVPKYHRASSSVYGSAPLLRIVKESKEGITLNKKKSLEIKYDEERSFDEKENDESEFEDGQQGFIPLLVNRNPDPSEKSTFSLNILKAIKETDEEIKKNPGKARLWIKMCEYQERLLFDEFRRSNSDDIKGKLKIENNSRSVKLSILEKALKEVKGCDHEILVSYYLQLGSEEWSKEETNQKFEEVLIEHPGYFNLWMKYAEYFTGISEFTFNDCLNMFSKCFKFLKQKLSDRKSCKERESTDVTSNFEVEEAILHLLIRLCDFLKNCGYYELAWSIFQANMELCYFYPRYLEKKLDSTFFESFSKFWNSDTPKFSEENARGWCNVLDDESSQQNQNFSSEIGIFQTVKLWYLNESKFDTNPPPRSTMSCRKLSGIDDPFRYIVFNDIQDFIVCFESETITFEFKYKFFAFCGVPLFPPGISTNSWFASYDKGIYNLLFGMASSESFINGQIAEKNSFQFPCSILPSYIDLFISLMSFKNLNFKLFDYNLAHHVKESMERAFHQLVFSADDEYLASVYLIYLKQMETKNLSEEKPQVK